VALVKGNIECTTCHNPHSQYIDPIAQNFLVKDSSNGKMCLACHNPIRVMNGQVNLLTGWQTSVHATATNQVASTGNVGLYTTVAVNACTSCHMEHNAPSPARLLRPATPSATSVDPATQDCITCHSSTNGSSSSINSYINPVPPPVYNEITKVNGHPIPSGTNGHDAAETAVLNNNRHATCVDCHNPHATQATTLPYPNPPAVRLPQTSVTGVSAVDGTTVLIPAVNQYESCLRCHGTSLGKQALIKYGYLPARFVFAADALNVQPQFSANATSSHPVMHTRSSAFPQPSLLTNMMNLDGITAGRVMGQQIFCTDCHNSDDNREFGGTGANGPHGSTFSHILERNYQFSQTTKPGGLVTNTFPNPDTSAQGPYAMCAKCHSLSIVFSPISTPLSPAASPLHVTHVQTDGFTCSVCHTAHGMGANSSTVTGERLINFDVNVVAPNQGTISYNHGSGTCVLVCHNVTHNADGTTH
jgi:nitrate/TMAO reductase-like tetraheme cytochrome c subunit